MSVIFYSLILLCMVAVFSFLSFLQVLPSCSFESVFYFNRARFTFVRILVVLLILIVSAKKLKLHNSLDVLALSGFLELYNLISLLPAEIYNVSTYCLTDGVICVIVVPRIRPLVLT